MAGPRSTQLYARAVRRLPGGVNSPVRAFAAVGGDPPFIKSGHMAELVDVDGRRYIDYVGAFGPALLGHAHPAVVAAVTAAAEQGLGFGAPTAGEVEFAEQLAARYPSMEMMRCVSSGTEATMSAVRVARGFTRRELIVKFEGGYHGHADPFLVRAGSGLATFGVPDSAGILASSAERTVTLAYNDPGALEALLTRHGDEVAAVIVEPVAGNMGCVPPAPGFLELLTELCRRTGALSIFDEVMTGSRVALGGAQGRFGLTPDLTCLGKVVGGGLPLAVYGGRADVMRMVSPLGPVYQAGTLSGNPLAIAAGLATLGHLDHDAYRSLERQTERLAAGLRKALSEHRVQGVVNTFGSMLTLFFADAPVTDFASANRSDRARFARFHRGLLERGVYFPPSQLETAFVSLAHTDAQIDETIRVAAAALADVSREQT